MSIYHLSNRRWQSRPFALVVGSGGTGGYVASGLCRLLPANANITLMDHDRVEEHNVLRQDFYPSDIGGFKSQVLATRLARLFGRPVGYCIQEFHRSSYYGAASPISDASLILGCVDNPMARAEIAASVEPTRFWIDAGNAENLGQVLIGNAHSPGALQGAFDPEKGICYALPLPSIQRPELLLPAEPSPLPAGMDPDCAEAIQLGGQSPVINQVMAALVLEVVRRLITDTCPWMALYADMNRGELRAVEATPANAARAFGLRSQRGFLVQKKRR